MKEELIKEAVVLLKEYLDTDASLSAAKTEIKTLIDLAEKVLAIGGKMPEKNADHGLCSPYEEQRIFDNGWDMAVDACVLAFAGMGLSEDIVLEACKRVSRLAEEWSVKKGISADAYAFTTAVVEMLKDPIHKAG